MDRATAPRREYGRRSILAAWAIAAALGLAACESVSDMKASLFGPPGAKPPCPEVSILREAAALTRYRPGPGRDLTDVVLEATIVDVFVSCAYTNKGKVYTNVAATLQVIFEAERGPADRDRVADLTYFVAMPQFYPRPQGRREFDTRIEFPGNRSKLILTDPEVVIDIPLSESRIGADYQIVIGFVLDREQIEENRRRPVGQ